MLQYCRGPGEPISRELLGPPVVLERAEAFTSNFRGLAHGALLVAAILVLAGCTPQDDVSARSQDSSYAFTSCKSLDVNRIRVLVRTSQGLEEAWVLAARDDVKLPAGWILEYGALPPGFEVQVPAASLDSIDWTGLQVYFERTSSSGAPVTRVFAEFSRSDLGQGAWFNTERGSVLEPCG